MVRYQICFEIRQGVRQGEIHSTLHNKLFNDDQLYLLEVSKGAKIRNRYNQVPHLTQDTNGKVTTHS